MFGLGRKAAVAVAAHMLAPVAKSTPTPLAEAGRAVVTSAERLARARAALARAQDEVAVAAGKHNVALAALARLRQT
jgi:hypothetical protein